jgi:transcriptional regulator with XRE-family HTH domain
MSFAPSQRFNLYTGNMQFASWLQAEMERRGWDQSELSRRSEAAGYFISHSQLSRILAGDRQAGPDACIAIAHALRIPREEVFRARGWLLREPNMVIPADTDPHALQIAEMLSDLPEDVRKEAIAALRATVEAMQHAAGHRTRFYGRMLDRVGGLRQLTVDVQEEPSEAEQFEAATRAWLEELDEAIDPQLKAYADELRQMKRDNPEAFQAHLQAALVLQELRARNARQRHEDTAQ